MIDQVGSQIGSGHQGRRWLVCLSSLPAARSGKCINPDAQRAALATFPTADHMQTVPADVQGAPRSGSGLPGATLRSGFIRRGSSSFEVSLLQSTRRAANFQENFRRQGIRKLRTISWNCLSSLVRDDCLSLHSFKKLLKTALF